MPLYFMMLSRRSRCNVAGIALGLCLAPFAIMLLDRREPITLTFDPAHCEERCRGEIVPYYVRSEQAVTINWPVIEHRVCGGTYTRRIKENLSGRIIFFDALPVAYTEGMHPDKQWFSKPLRLPKLDPGPATYWTEGKRWCNFIQQYIWPMAFKSPEIQFEVLPDKPTPGLQGTQGPPGIQGFQGVQGVQGAQGAQGAQGKRGDPRE